MTMNMIDSVLITYAEQEREIANRLSTYIHDKKANYEAPTFPTRDLTPTASRDMHSINPESRIEFAALMFAEVAGLAEVARENRTPLYHLTITPLMFALPLKEALLFDPHALRQLLKSEFPGVSMIGMIEASIFPRIEWPGAAVPGVVHYHAHAIAWGPPKVVMQRRADAFSSKYPCFIPALKSGHVTLLKPGALLGIAEYHLKSPANSYTVSTFQPMNPSTGVFFDDMFTKLWKERMSLKRRTQLYNCSLTYFRLPDLVVAQGQGSEMWKRVRANLPAPFHAHNLWKPVVF
jgi:hypothetical protein